MGWSSDHPSPFGYILYEKGLEADMGRGRESQQAVWVSRCTGLCCIRCSNFICIGVYIMTVFLAVNFALYVLMVLAS